MNFKRIGRILVCLLLVCALLINISPIKAKADVVSGGLVAAGATLVGVPVAVWAAAALIAIGVTVDWVSDPNYNSYDALVDDVSTFLTNAGTYVKDGMVDMYRVVDETGKAVFYAAGDAMEAVRGWVFENSICVPSFPDLSSLTSSQLSHYEFMLSQYPYLISCIDSSGNLWFYHHGRYANISWDSDRSQWCMEWPSGYSSDYHYYTPDGQHSVVQSTNRTFTDSYPCRLWTADESELVSPFGFVLSNVPTVPIDGTGAREWSEDYTNNGLYIVGTGGGGNNNPNDGKWFWPLAFGLTVAELYAMSQAEQWAAETPAEFDQYETKEEFTVSPGTEVEFGQSIEIAPVTNPNPDSGIGSDPDSGGDSAESTWWQRLYQWLLEIKTSINELPNKFDEHFENLNNNIQEAPNKFETWIQNVQTSVDAVAESILGTADEINAAISNLPNAFTAHVQNILSAIAAVPQAIIAGIQTVLQNLFVPDPEFIPNKVEALKAEYKFLDPMLGTGEDLKLFFQNIGSQPPIIWIDLGAGTGWHPMGGKVKFIDLTWYAQYKPTVDPIVGGFIWLWVAWRLFKGIPGLLSGDSGTVGAPTIAPDFTFNQARLPAGRSRRKKEGE